MCFQRLGPPLPPTRTGASAASSRSRAMRPADARRSGAAGERGAIPQYGRSCDHDHGVTNASGCLHVSQPQLVRVHRTDRDRGEGFGFSCDSIRTTRPRPERVFLAANAEGERFGWNIGCATCGVYRWAIEAASPGSRRTARFSAISSGVVVSTRASGRKRRWPPAIAASICWRGCRWCLMGRRIAEGGLKNRVRRLAREVEADYYFNFLIDDANPARMRLNSAGALPVTRRSVRADRGRRISGRAVAATREPVVIDDLDASDDPACGGVIGLDGKCYAGFPLIAEGRLIGTISFASTLGRASMRSRWR